MNYPNGNLIDAGWFTFRQIQVELLHALTLVYLSMDKSWKRGQTDLEHDVHDLDYLALGLHAGNFASNESKTKFSKLGWKFEFLCPNGTLIQSN